MGVDDDAFAQVVPTAGWEKKPDRGVISASRQGRLGHQWRCSNDYHLWTGKCGNVIIDVRDRVSFDGRNRVFWIRRVVATMRRAWDIWRAHQHHTGRSSH